MSWTLLIALTKSFYMGESLLPINDLLITAGLAASIILLNKHQFRERRKFSFIKNVLLIKQIPYGMVKVIKESISQKIVTTEEKQTTKYLIGKIVG